MEKHDDRPVIGVDLGGTNISAGVLDRHGALLASDKAKTRADQGTGAMMRRMAQLVRDIVKQAGLRPDDIAALGIGAPGAIDVDKGIVINAPNLRWNQFPLGAALRQELKMPVVVDNDVNVAAWGEYQAGAGRDQPNMFAVWVGAGIGGGFVLNGELYRGHYSTAGEIGHVVLHADAPLGRRTLENGASRTAITSQITQLILANHPSKITSLIDGDFGAIRSKVLARAVELDDQLTLEIIGHATRYIGAAIANVVTLMSLPCVVMGGGLTTAMGRSWVDEIRKEFEVFVFPRDLRSCRIVMSKLGDDAGIIGAALLARESLSKPRKGKKK